MNIELQFKMRSNPIYYKYLHENSYWYKILNRDPQMINKMTEEMKKAYKLTIEDKIDDLNSKMNIVKAFMDTLKQMINYRFCDTI